MELDVCPFCGEKAMIVRLLHKREYYRGEDGTMKLYGGWQTYFARCTHCFARTKECDTEIEAVNAWNDRLKGTTPFPSP